jgi:hypothetical protein
MLTDYLTRRKASRSEKKIIIKIKTVRAFHQPLKEKE